MIRRAGPLLLVVACDQGTKVEPAAGSAQPAPAPLPSPDPAPPVDAMAIDAPAPAPAAGIWVRACNDTGKTIDKLVLREQTLPPLKTGECSFYEQVPEAYPSGFARFRIGSDEFELKQGPDSPERKLAPGLYSYHIVFERNVDDPSPRIRTKLDSSATTYEVRTCNDSSFDFTLVQVFEVPVSDDKGLEAHRCTPYHQAKHARATSSASFRVGKDDNFDLQPSGVGRMLPPGKWSYHLSITDGRDHEMRMIVKQDP